MHGLPAAIGITLLLLLACVVTRAAAVDEAEPGVVRLPLPRATAAQEAVWIRITVGALPRGARLRVSTHDGVLIGSVAPFATPRGQQTMSYDLALPPAAVAGGEVRLRVEVIQPDVPTRAPVAGEVEDVALRYVPVTK